MSYLFWPLFIGAAFGLAVGIGFLSIVFLKKLPQFLPRNRKQLIEAVNLLKKVSWQGYFEANMRVSTGKTLIGLMVRKEPVASIKFNLTRCICPALL